VYFRNDPGWRKDYQNPGGMTEASRMPTIGWRGQVALDSRVPLIWRVSRYVKPPKYGAIR
jgi:hypothetical protein